MGGVESEQDFWGHVEELLIRLRRIIIAIIIASFSAAIAPYSLEPYTPLAVILPRILLNSTVPDRIEIFNMIIDIELIQTNPFGGFNIIVASSLLMGIILASPVIAYEIAAFLAPALYPEEKKYIIQLTIIGVILFLTGIAFAYYIVVPWALKFLFTMSLVVAGEQGLLAIADIETLFWLIVKIIVATAIVFEVPLIIYLILITEIVKIEWFRGEGLKYAFVASLIIGAIISPDPTGLGMILIAIPYFLLIVIAVKAAEYNLKRKKSSTSQKEYPGKDDAQ